MILSVISVNSSKITFGGSNFVIKKYLQIKRPMKVKKYHKRVDKYFI